MYLKKCLNYTCLVALIFLVSCGGGKQKWQSERLQDIKNARIIYRAKNYERAAEMFSTLVSQNVITGDVLYYYAFCLQENGESEKAHEYYLKSVKWFETYETEFPEDANFDKAVFNIGILYYGTGPNRDLTKVKKIWDYGIALNKENTFIQNEYPRLLLSIDFEKLTNSIVKFSEELEAVKSLNELNAIKTSYTPVIGEVDLSRYVTVVTPMPSWVQDAVVNFHAYLKEKEQVLPN